MCRLTFDMLGLTRHEAFHIPAVLFCRPPKSVLLKDRLGGPLLQFLVFGSRREILRMLLGDLSADSPFNQAQHPDGPGDDPDFRGNDFVDLDQPRWLDLLRGDLHVTGSAGFCGEGPGFVEPDGPEPFVDSNG